MLVLIKSRDRKKNKKMILNNNPTLFLRLGYFMDDS